MTNYRIEKDSFGEIKVSDSKYWGAQTQRSLDNFKVGIEKMPKSIINALLIAKRAAAICNAHFGKIPIELANCIVEVVDEIMHGQYDEHFPLVVWQTGSGTQTNMNVNEVIAHLVNKKNLSVELGTIHPNDHINMSQSSNDVFPTAIHIATTIEVEKRLLPALATLEESLFLKEKEFSKIIKIGRTHLQDAVPMTLGQEFSGYVTQIRNGIKRVRRSMQDVRLLAQGGTAVGTGLNSPRGFDLEFSKQVSKFTGIEFLPAHNKFESLATRDAIVDLSGALNVLSVSLMKIANDIRLLSSGPRCGIGELILPANEPGSSIMPGKVNPTQCESLAMVCAQVMGNHVAITIAGSQGHLELNTFQPLIAYNILQSISLLADGCISFSKKCISGIKVDQARMKKLLNKSLMLVTALVPHIGYENAAKIAKYAHDHNCTLKDAAQKLELVSNHDYDTWVKVEDMIAN